MMDLSKRFNTSLQKEAFTQAKVAYQDYIVSSESKFEGKLATA